MNAQRLHALSKGTVAVTLTLLASGCTSLGAALQSSATPAAASEGYEICTRGIPSRIPLRHGDGETCRYASSLAEIY